MTDSNRSSPRSFLDDISTCWPTINNPVQFTMRYAPAIRRYLQAILRNPDEADEAVQDFLVRVFDRGFQVETKLTGRFRDYLKAAVRYSAVSRLRRRKDSHADSAILASISENAPDVESEADREWVERWRQCVLERAWQSLEFIERQSKDNLGYTILRLAVEMPHADSATLAADVSQQTQRTMSAVAFRKQLSRARRQFAEAVIEEVRQSLATPTRDAIEEELIELGLHRYLRELA